MKFHGTMKINDLGHLEVGGCDTVDLAKRYGTPLYIFDETKMRATCREYYNAFTEKYHNAQVLYASKAFLTTAVCRIIEEEGLGLDVVSGGELYTALKAGFPMDRVYFHGNNKTPEELRMALDNEVGRIVVDNFYELEILDALARERHCVPEVLLRITPGVEAHTHDYIRTGQIDSKFGFTLPNGQALEAVKAVKEKHVSFRGVHCHIGSQIFEMESYVHAVDVMVQFVADIKRETGLAVEELNLGGGFGIYYSDGDQPAAVEEYADMVMARVKEKTEEFELLSPRVLVEPGRSIAGPAGSTLYTIGSVKEIPGVRKYVAVDGGMTDNIRPALYQAKYEVILANKADRELEQTVSITGKCCESGDMLAWDVELPQTEAGDLMLMPCTGAYGYSMANNYNRLTKPGAVLVKDGQAELIIKAETYQDLIRNDVMPERLAKKKEVCLQSIG
ncbi:diaminopimelate decarboxylase [Metallumcola ferriviriculae]|uniref:Diaminopimelate decarboxylase n=1 Tax=Metallumcola ferriviriculae TaxID=3039180 RepID=A0AAU0UR77_9FIRM|nr:diaminopimelate decarboxylase [Desulfitibacteraceae bacterium MK1]